MKLILASLIALALFAVPAFADPAVTTTTTTVSVPWGEWLSTGIEQIIIPILATVLLAILAWAAKFLPASLRAYATTKNTAAVEQLLQKAISFALNKAALASVGQSVTIPVGSAAVTDALNYAIQHGPDWLLKWAGGTTGIQQKIVARLPVTAVVVTEAPKVSP